MHLLAALLAIHLAPVSPAGPNRQPQLAVAGKAVVMVFGSGDAIWLARSTDNGRSFAAPAKVADLPKLALGRHRGPRVAAIGDTLIVSAIGSSGDLLAWRSTDAGRTWSVPRAVNDKPQAAREGLQAMAADADGHMAAAWLDDRNGRKALWGAFSNDAGATWSKNVMLYENPGTTICECCHPSLAALGHGEFAVMWRNSLDGYRDFYAMRVRDGQSPTRAEKQGTGSWKLAGCPMDGGGIVARDGQLVSAWRREADIYLAETGKPELKVGTGQDAALGVNNQGLYVVWSTPEGIQVHLPNAGQATNLSSAGAFPSIVTLPDGAMLVAWEENGAIATTRL